MMCIVIYIAMLPPRAEKIRSVLSLTLHLWCDALNLSRHVIMIDRRLITAR